MSEARDPHGKTRILFTRVDDNTFIIIDAIIKKTDNSLGYKNQLESRYKNYLQQKSYILKHLKDEDFILRQEAYLAEAKEMLGLEPSKRKIKEV